MAEQTLEELLLEKLAQRYAELFDEACQPLIYGDMSGQPLGILADGHNR